LTCNIEVNKLDRIRLCGRPGSVSARRRRADSEEAGGRRGQISIFHSPTIASGEWKIEI